MSEVPQNQGGISARGLTRLFEIAASVCEAQNAEVFFSKQDGPIIGHGKTIQLRHALNDGRLVEVTVEVTHLEEHEVSRISDLHVVLIDGGATLRYIGEVFEYSNGASPRVALNRWQRLESIPVTDPGELERVLAIINLAASSE